MRCENCRALCRETDGRCHQCGESLRVGVAGNLPAIFGVLGAAAGAVAGPAVFFSPKLSPEHSTFAVTAALAGVGAVAGAVAGYLVGVFLAWASDND